MFLGVAALLFFGTPIMLVIELALRLVFLVRPKSLLARASAAGDRVRERGGSRTDAWLQSERVIAEFDAELANMGEGHPRVRDILRIVF
jgi:hypothetical protein